MASVHRVKTSRFWFGSVSLPDGGRILRSTKQTDKSTALRVAMEWERIARGPKPESAEQARRVVADLFSDLLGSEYGRIRANDYLKRWLGSLQGTVDQRTLDGYESAVGSFLKVAGAEKQVDALSQEDLTKWRLAERKRVSAATVNNRLKAVRAMLRQAVREGFARTNVAEGLKPLKQSESKVRRPFTREELAKIMAVCDETWRLVILLGLQTGQRLGDIVRLRWDAIRKECWEFRSRKTGRGMVVPLSPEVQGLLAARRLGAPTEGSVFPELVAKLHAEDVGPLSKEFAMILHKAGLRDHSPHNTLSKRLRKKKKEENPGNQRKREELSFHSLRHTARTWLEEAGQPKAVIDALIGHEGDTGKIYTTVGEDALRSAAGVLGGAMG